MTGAPSGPDLNHHASLHVKTPLSAWVPRTYTPVNDARGVFDEKTANTRLIALAAVTIIPPGRTTCANTAWNLDEADGAGAISLICAMCRDRRRLRLSLIESSSGRRRHEIQADTVVDRFRGPRPAQRR
jgi:hypothetical protein